MNNKKQSMIVMSDLHIEGFANPKIYENPEKADVLVLAGDINVTAERVWTDLKRFAENFNQVVYVPGNHEWYHNSFEEFHAKMTLFVQGQSSIFYLCNSSVKIEDTTFIGTPLWTNFRNSPKLAMLAKGMITDFRWYSPKECMERGIDAQQWLQHEYENTPGKKVIVTHWLPAVECIDPIYMTPSNEDLNCYFANDMGSWIKELTDVKFWFFGHTHSSVDVMLGDCRVVANPAGYRHRAGYYENRNFNENLIFEL